MKFVFHSNFFHFNFVPGPNRKTQIFLYISSVIACFTFSKIFVRIKLLFHSHFFHFDFTFFQVYTMMNHYLKLLRK